MTRPPIEKSKTVLKCHIYFIIFVDRQLRWMDHLVFICNTVCKDGWIYVRSRQHQKVNLRSIMRTQWPIFVEPGIWVVMGNSTTHAVCLHRMLIFNTPFAYMF